MKLKANFSNFAHGTWKTFPEGIEIFKQYALWRHIDAFFFRDWQVPIPKSADIRAAFEAMPDDLHIKDHVCWFMDYSGNVYITSQPYSDISLLTEKLSEATKFIAACIAHDVDLSILRFSTREGGWHFPSAMVLEMRAVRHPCNWHPKFDHYPAVSVIKESPIELTFSFSIPRYTSSNPVEIKSDFVGKKQ